jgi:Na+/melibiose symporter-like transporter
LIAYNLIEISLIITSTTLVSAMMADVVEDSELKTGRRSEGTFFAARSFIQKSMSGLGIVLGTMLLGFVGFPQNAQPGEVDLEIIKRLGLGYIPVVVGLYLSAIACLMAYRISREQHLANLEQLEANANEA